MNNNVDNAEIQKFAALASKWWDKSGEFKPLHDINPLRLDFIEQACGGLFGKNILDIGCGGGILAEAMAKRGANVTAIDMAEESIEVAKLHGLESNITVNYRLSTAEDFATEYQGQFDVVTCLEMLEHVPNPSSVVDACSTLCKEDGNVIFSTLNRNPKSWLYAIVAAEYVLKLVPKGTHNHKQFIKPSELMSAIRQTSLKAEAITGIHLNPLTMSYYLSNKNIDVNYLIHCKKI